MNQINLTSIFIKTDNKIEINRIVFTDDVYRSSKIAVGDGIHIQTGTPN